MPSRSALWERGRWSRRGRCAARCTCSPPRRLGLWQAGARDLPTTTVKPAGCAASGSPRAQLEALIDAVAEASRRRAADARGARDAVVERDRLGGASARCCAGSWGSMLKPAAYEGGCASGRASGRRCASRARTSGSPARPTPPTPTRRCARSRAASSRPTAPPRARTSRAGGRRPRPCAGSWRSGDEVDEVDVEGEALWMLRRCCGSGRDGLVRGVVRLLPAFDQYVVARVAARGALFLAGRLPRPDLPPAGVAVAVLLVDGRHGGRLASRAQGPPAASSRSSRSRACRARVSVLPSRARRSGSPPIWAARAELGYAWPTMKPTVATSAPPSVTWISEMPERDPLEALADAGDQHQLGADDGVGDRERGADVRDEERQRVREAADERRQAGDQAARDGAAAAGDRAVVGQPLGEPHRDGRAERGGQAHEQGCARAARRRRRRRSAPAWRSSRRSGRSGRAAPPAAGAPRAVERAGSSRTVLSTLMETMLEVYLKSLQIRRPCSIRRTLLTWTSVVDPADSES